MEDGNCATKVLILEKDWRGLQIEVQRLRDEVGGLDAKYNSLCREVGHYERQVNELRGKVEAKGNTYGENNGIEQGVLMIVLRFGIVIESGVGFIVENRASGYQRGASSSMVIGSRSSCSFPVGSLGAVFGPEGTLKNWFC